MAWIPRTVALLATMATVTLFSTPMISVIADTPNETDGVIPMVPTPPMNLEATVKTEGQSVHLTWDPPLDKGASPLHYYKIYRNGGMIALVGPDVTWYTDADPDDLTTTFYGVSAVNSHGESLPAVAYPGASGSECVHVGSTFPFLSHDIPDCFKEFPVIGPIYGEHVHPIYLFVKDFLPSSTETDRLSAKPS